MPNDLCNTEPGEELTRFLKDSLAVGNERDARCERFTIENFILDSKHNLKSKHKVRGAVIYDVSYDVLINEDVRNPNPQGVKICVEVRNVPLCVTLADILAVIGAVHKASQIQANELGGIASFLR